jgi:hypothetical protein
MLPDFNSISCKYILQNFRIVLEKFRNSAGSRVGMFFEFPNMGNKHNIT